MNYTERNVVEYMVEEIRFEGGEAGKIWMRGSVVFTLAGQTPGSHGPGANFRVSAECGPSITFDEAALLLADRARKVAERFLGEDAGAGLQAQRQREFDFANEIAAIRTGAYKR